MVPFTLQDDACKNTDNSRIAATANNGFVGYSGACDPMHAFTFYGFKSCRMLSHLIFSNFRIEIMEKTIDAEARSELWDKFNDKYKDRKMPGMKCLRRTLSKFQ